MSRVRKLFTIVLPSMLIGGLVFGSALGHAHDGRESVLAYADSGADRAARRAPRSRVAQAPTLPRPPKPPKPPKPPVVHDHGHGVSISVNGHEIDLSGIAGMVGGQLEGVRQMILHNPNIPPKVRAKVLSRIDRVKASVDKRLAKLKHKRFDQMGDELEQMGEEIEEALEGLDEELEELGEELGKSLGKGFKVSVDRNRNRNRNRNTDHDHDDDFSDAIPMTPDLQDADTDDMRDAINDLKGMAIKPDQKARIAKLRAESDRAVTAARKQLDQLSGQLEAALGNPQTSDAEIGRLVDAISRQEAEIRKARIVAWHNARRILDDAQRKRIEAAAAKRGK